MSQATWVQDQFSYGEISPKAAAKSNQEFYYKSLAQAKNVIVTPQATITRRFGLKYIGNVATADTFKEIKLYNFQIGAYSNYLLVVAPDIFQIYYENFLCATIPNPYPRSVIQDLKFMQENGSPMILNGYYHPKQIKRLPSNPIQIQSVGLSDTLSTLGLGMKVDQVLPVLFTTNTDLPVTIPQISATRIYFIRANTLTDFSIYNSPNEATADNGRFTIVSGGIDSQVIPQNSWEVVDFEFHNSPTFDFSGDYSENKFEYFITDQYFEITAGTPFFTEEFVKGIIYTPGQVLRIESFTSASRLEVVYIDGKGDPVVEEGEGPYKWEGSDVLITIPAFSERRGWPSSGCFFQSRAVLCSTPELPNFVAFSVVSNPHDFDDLGIFDSDGISTLINSDNGSLIFYPFSSKTLIIFTAGGIFSTPYSGTAPITSNSVRIDPETEEFVQDISPVWLDNNLFYVAGGGSVIKSMKFDITINSYNLIDASDFSSHLIRNPLTLATYKNNFNNDINLLLVINSDGTCACHNSVYQEKVMGWSELTTKNGLFRYADGARGNCYFLIERHIEGQTFFFIEKSDFNSFLDSSITKEYDVPTTNIIGLGNLNGQSVKVKADGFSLGDYIVDNGSIVIDRPSLSVEVGMGIDVLIETLPFNIPESGTYFYYHPKIYSSVFIDYFESYNIYVNGENVPMLNFSNEDLFDPPIPKTGFTEMPLTMDPCLYNGITITQTEPFPFTLRALGYEVKK